MTNTVPARKSLSRSIRCAVRRRRPAVFRGRETFLEKHSGIGARKVVACLAVALLMLFAFAAPVRAQAAATAQGLFPERGSFSLLPWETIDTYSGNVVLSFTDMVLPGNAGFSIAVRRSFNMNNGTWTWHLGLPSLAVGPGGYPRLEDEDGGTTYFLRDVQNPDVYYSTSFWRYTASLRKLESPAGVRYHFSEPDGRLTRAEDVFGNSIDVVYVTTETGRRTELTQHLGNGQNRTLTADYDSQGRITSISCTGYNTWYYGWVGMTLVSVTPPEGNPWSFGYSGRHIEETNEDESVVTVTTPGGGSVAYTARAHTNDPTDPDDYRWRSLKLYTREAGGRDVPASKYRFDYSNNGTQQLTTIDGQDATTFHAEYSHDASRFSALLDYA